MTDTSLALGVVWLLGCLIGYAQGHHHGWNAHAAADKISTGVPSQMRKVRDTRSTWGLDADWTTSNHATVTTVDGEFEVIVRQPAHPTAREGE